jgi:hypothetical protein
MREEHEHQRQPQALLASIALGTAAPSYGQGRPLTAASLPQHVEDTHGVAG